jgi:hypothetical protein
VRLTRRSFLVGLAAGAGLLEVPAWAQAGDTLSVRFNGRYGLTIEEMLYGEPVWRACWATDYPRTLTVAIDAPGQLNGVTATLRGTDVNGQPVVENIAVPTNGQAVESKTVWKRLPHEFHYSKTWAPLQVPRELFAERPGKNSRP